MKVFEGLENLKRRGPYQASGGICNNVNGFFAEPEMHKIWGDNYTRCFGDWSEFTGDLFYPVPAPPGLTPSFAFNETSDENMWNPNHLYGAARLRLLDHCINWFKERDL